MTENHLKTIDIQLTRKKQKIPHSYLLLGAVMYYHNAHSLLELRCLPFESIAFNVQASRLQELAWWAGTLLTDVS